ncbi:MULTISPECIES: hypothetical protein [Streptomyces]|uniref:hypothetical protein n=1 Tax=Streptomyces TaxID=1883 RepID=UPI0036498574
MLTNWQKLARVRAELRDYYQTLAPRYGDTPDVVEVSPDRIVVVLSTMRMRDVRGGMEITHKGLRWYTINLVDGTWVMDEPVEIENKLPEPERHMSYGVTPADEHEAKRNWEEMCYRPGTPSCPMDNIPRQRQGYRK